MENPLSTEPDRIAVAGDWHGNLRWACFTVEKIAKKLPDGGLILHAGDFGIWPGRPGSVYLVTLNEILRAHNLTLVFVDGNHEDFDQLISIAAMSKTLAHAGPFEVKSNIWWAARTCRWEWHGRTWLAMGGAASPDRAIRVQRDWGWWPQEDITDGQISAAIMAGPADVILSHDAPSGVFIPYGPPQRDWMQIDLDRGEENRAKLQKLYDGVQPLYGIHGHYHRAYQKMVKMAHGDVEMTGLDMDGTKLNWVMLDPRDMSWEVPQPDA